MPSRTASRRRAGRLGGRPGLQVGEAFAARGGEDGGRLPCREDRRHRPESEPGGAQARSGRGRAVSVRRSPAVLHVRHSSSAPAPFVPGAAAPGVTTGPAGLAQAPRVPREPCEPRKPPEPGRAARPHHGTSRAKTDSPDIRVTFCPDDHSLRGVRLPHQSARSITMRDCIVLVSTGRRTCVRTVSMHCASIRVRTVRGPSPPMVAFGPVVRHCRRPGVPSLSPSKGRRASFWRPPPSPPPL